MQDVQNRLFMFNFLWELYLQNIMYAFYFGLFWFIF
jgi:hypothetical protein